MASKRRKAAVKETEQNINSPSPPTVDSSPEKEQPILTPRRIVTRLVFVLASIIIARFYFGPEPTETVFATKKENVGRRFMEVSCSREYLDDLKSFPSCRPKKCGRAVMDNIISPKEASQLLSMAKRGFSHGGGDGGVSILDLHSGALSSGEKFADIFALLGPNQETFTDGDFTVFRKIRLKIHNAIAREFGLSPQDVYLTKPSFFSRMTGRAAKTLHDEYWHIHVDKVAYGSFHFTGLLYLTNYGEDFTGGRFIYVDENSNSTVEPRLGRVSFFTSGQENQHFVEPVSGGTRYALTVAFTCDAEEKINDPELKSG